ncbi:hypothetical protein F9L07_19860 [Pimelobacter simplex]|uniref:Uncharacterized protein n=1 Tax=Nocardioides simplex TaxID=2045 RepID=A0A7J5DVE1_NOCSI|nr:hypothetical protein [Pimelobacter simplex]KAB2809298.1 hypothetical protein F9L07_19860 [Pimelobacter simplex]
MSWRGLFSGALALIALEALVRTDASAGRLGGLLDGVGSLIRSAMSPAVPAIPDLSGSSSAGGQFGSKSAG